MLLTLDTPHLTLVFLVTVVALTSAMVWLFCELDRRFGRRFLPRGLQRFGYLPDGRRDHRAS
ncbi:MAG: hypothetical protein JWQ94_3757, partial [Tardiphaga sp.]|nr:hypothetical protein [Tardiphaga sp.]